MFDCIHTYVTIKFKYYLISITRNPGRKYHSIRNPGRILIGRPEIHQESTRNMWGNGKFWQWHSKMSSNSTANFYCQCDYLED